MWIYTAIHSFLLVHKNSVTYISLGNRHIIRVQQKKIRHQFLTTKDNEKMTRNYLQSNSVCTSTETY